MQSGNDGHSSIRSQLDRRDPEDSAMIAPARQYTYPQQIAGERRRARQRRPAIARFGPATSGTFLATCASASPTQPCPLESLPAPTRREMCAVAAATPTSSTPATGALHPIQLKPVTEVCVLPTHSLLLFIGFSFDDSVGTTGTGHGVRAAELEGVRITSIEENTLHGTGWNLLTDKEVPFSLRPAHWSSSGRGFFSSTGNAKKLSAASPCFSIRVCSNPP